MGENIIKKITKKRIFSVLITLSFLLGFSPLVFANYQGNLKTDNQPNLIQGIEYTVANVSDYLLSPDGTQVAYIKSPNGDRHNCELWVADKSPCGAQLINPVLISSEAEYNGLEDWMGDWILYRIRREPGPFPEGFIPWSGIPPEGAPEEYYGRNELWKMKADGSENTQVTHTFYPGNGIKVTENGWYWNRGSVVWGRFIPGTNLVYFQAHNGNGWYRSFVCNDDGTGMWYHISYPDWTWVPCLSPTGNKLLWGRQTNHWRPTTFKTCNVDGSGRTTIRAFPQKIGVTVLADGNTLVWHQDNNIYAMDMDGTNVRTVLDDEYINIMNIWGNYNPIDAQGLIMGSNRDPDGNMHMFKMNVDGTGIEQLTEGPYNDEYPILSPDGSYLSYLRLPEVFDKGSSTVPYPYELVIIWVGPDITPPIINIDYHDGDGTDGYPGKWDVSAYDPEDGINQNTINILIDGQFAGNTLGEYNVPNTLGEHIIYVEVENNIGCPALKSESVVIIDDDINKPYFENILITDDHRWLNISFNGLDIPEGDDLGLSKNEIYVDGNLIHTYLPTSIEDSFSFNLANEWILDKGVHDVRVVIVDADDDRPNDALNNEFSSTFEVTLEEMYEYVIWQLEEVKNYVDENLEGILSWAVRFLLWLAQNALRDAYDAFIADEGVSGLVKDKFAQALTHLSGFIIELFNNWDIISDEDAQFIVPALRTIRNNIVLLMGESVGVEQSINIALIEIELLNLNDFIDENIDDTDSFVLKSSIAGAILMLEGALFKIVLDLSTECMLTCAQIALDYALAEVDNLLNSDKISQELANTLNSKIIQVQVDIEMVKNAG